MHVAAVTEYTIVILECIAVLQGLAQMDIEPHFLYRKYTEWSALLRTRRLLGKCR